MPRERVEYVGWPETRARSKPGRQPLLWLVGAVAVSGTAVAGTATGVGAAVATAIGVLVVLATLGWALWRTAPNRQDAKTGLGTGLLVSVIVAGAVGSAQFAIEDRRTRLEHQRDLRLTIGLQRTLAGINLSGENLAEFVFSGRHLEKATLDRSILVDAKLERAALCNATLTGANLQRAEAAEADLSGAVITNADLRGANLSNANLQWADLRGTKLAGAVLDGTDLRGASLRSTDVAAAQLNGALIDEATIWPPGVDPDVATRKGQVPTAGPGPRLCDDPVADRSTPTT